MRIHLSTTAILLLIALTVPDSIAQTHVDSQAQSSMGNRQGESTGIRRFDAEAEGFRRKELTTTNTAEQKEKAERRAALIKQLDQINARIDPRTRYVSPAESNPVIVAYKNAVAEKIESYGSSHFPERDGKPIYGKTIVIITVAASGSVERAEVARQSGTLALDKHAIDIVHRVAPFQPFGNELKQKFDHLVFVFPFNYLRDE